MEEKARCMTQETIKRKLPAEEKVLGGDKRSTRCEPGERKR